MCVGGHFSLKIFRKNGRDRKGFGGWGPLCFILMTQTIWERHWGGRQLAVVLYGFRFGFCSQGLTLVLFTMDGKIWHGVNTSLPMFLYSMLMDHNNRKWTNAEVMSGHFMKCVSFTNLTASAKPQWLMEGNTYISGCWWLLFYWWVKVCFFI